MLIDNCHDYAASLTLVGVEDDMEEFPPLAITQSKSPAPKKMLYTRENSGSNPLSFPRESAEMLYGKLRRRPTSYGTMA